MSTLNLHLIDPKDLLPMPEVPEAYGPRNAEDERVLGFVRAAIDANEWHRYESPEALLASLKIRSK